MTVSEQDRHDLYETFIEIFGRKEAATLIALLPPTAWGEVTTKRDLQEMESRLESRLEARIVSSQNKIILAMMGTMLATVIAVAGLAFAAAGLT